jgi:hypothetical protein
VSGVGGLSSSEVVLGDGVTCRGWWLVQDEEGGPGRIVAGPFPDRADATWAAGERGAPEDLRPVYGLRRADGVLKRQPSPQDWEWLTHLGEQLDRLPSDWDGVLTDEDPLTTLVVEVVAALAEAGLSLHDPDATGTAVGGVCLIPEPEMAGIVVTWRQHDRMSVEQVHGATADGVVQHVMNRALADVLRSRGFVVDAFGGATGHVVRSVA